MIRQQLSSPQQNQRTTPTAKWYLRLVHLVCFVFFCFIYKTLSGLFGFEKFISSSKMIETMKYTIYRHTITDWTIKLNIFLQTHAQKLSVFFFTFSKIVCYLSFFLPMTNSFSSDTVSFNMTDMVQLRCGSTLHTQNDVVWLRIALAND